MVTKEPIKPYIIKPYEDISNVSYTFRNLICFNFFFFVLFGVLLIFIGDFFRSFYAPYFGLGSMVIGILGILITSEDKKNENITRDPDQPYDS